MISLRRLLTASLATAAFGVDADDACSLVRVELIGHNANIGWNIDGAFSYSDGAHTGPEEI